MLPSGPPSCRGGRRVLLYPKRGWQRSVKIPTTVFALARGASWEEEEAGLVSAALGGYRFTARLRTPDRGEVVVGDQRDRRPGKKTSGIQRHGYNPRWPLQIGARDAPWLASSVRGVPSTSPKGP